MAVEKEKSIEQIKKLEQFLPKKSKEEMAQILAYGEKIKAEGEKKKKEFWSKNNWEAFSGLLSCRHDCRDEIEKKYEYLDKLKGLEREKFIEEYLHDDILYGGETDLQFGEKPCTYEKWKSGEVDLEEGMRLSFEECKIGYKGLEDIVKNIKLKECVQLDLGGNEIGDEGVKLISKMELKEGVRLLLYANQIGSKGAKAISKIGLMDGVVLDLQDNQIGSKGAKAIAENMKLKEGVFLNLGRNNIGLEGARALSKLELKEGVKLYLYGNKIGDEGVGVIAENMELKKGMKINLSGNNISDEGAKVIMEKMKLKEGVVLDLQDNQIHMKDDLEKWALSANCRVII